jgi:hypothetical protein
VETPSGPRLSDADAERLAAALDESGRAVAAEAAAVLRWSGRTDVDSTALEPELLDALLAALDRVEPTPGLEQLHAALVRSARSEPRRRRLARRLHNPRLRSCECLSDCWCKRTGWGRAIRWYVPGKLHSPLSAGSRSAAR